MFWSKSRTTEFERSLFVIHFRARINETHLSVCLSMSPLLLFIRDYLFPPLSFPLPSNHVKKKVIFTLEFCSYIPKHMCPSMIISHITVHIYADAFSLRISSSNALKREIVFSLTAEWIKYALGGRDSALARDKKTRERARNCEMRKCEMTREKARWNMKWYEKKKYEIEWERGKKGFITSEMERKREKNSAKWNEKEKRREKKAWWNGLKTRANEKTRDLV